MSFLFGGLLNRHLTQPPECPNFIQRLLSCYYSAEFNIESEFSHHA